MTSISYRFLQPGRQPCPEPGRLYLDVGDALEPGIIDHHHQQGETACTALLVLRHPGMVRGQVTGTPDNRCLTIIVHANPDLDAVTSALFASRIARDLPLADSAGAWADYVCRIDRGETRLDPGQPITPYSLFMARMHLVRQTSPPHAELAMLEAGIDFVTAILASLEQGKRLGDNQWLEADPAFLNERRFIREDYRRYREDLARAECCRIRLPRSNGRGCAPAPALFIDRPCSVLFKSWARGDARAAGHEPGFIFTGIQLGPARHILSVDPDSGLWLKGLGSLLEERETVRRRQLGKERKGAPRPGYNSPDPWYDGRSPIHDYTIVDAPRSGTILTPEEIRAAVMEFSRGCEQP